MRQCDLDRKEQICEVCHRMWQLGWVAANDGNVSARLTDGTYWITPSGVSKSFIKPDILLRVDADMTEATGEEAKTIHRMLEYGGEENVFTRDENYPLETDCLIVDEMSMTSGQSAFLKSITLRLVCKQRRPPTA